VLLGGGAESAQQDRNDCRQDSFHPSPRAEFSSACNLRWPVVECCSLQDTMAVDVNTSALAARHKCKNLARGGVRGMLPRGRTAKCKFL
jgi:hypothetical protein